jgi:hypothetical protein
LPGGDEKKRRVIIRLNSLMVRDENKWDNGINFIKLFCPQVNKRVLFHVDQFCLSSICWFHFPPPLKQFTAQYANRWWNIRYDIITTPSLKLHSFTQNFVPYHKAIQSDDDSTFLFITAWQPVTCL